MLTLITAPTVEPVTTIEARLQLRIDSVDPQVDAELARMITSARTSVERRTRRALLTQTWELQLDEFPTYKIELPRPPLLTVTSVTYRDTAGAWQTLAAASYVVTAPAGPTAERGTVTLAKNYTWPSTYGDINSVKVRYTAGYGAAASSVPGDIRSAVLLSISDLYEGRVSTNAINASTIDALLSPYVSMRWQ